MNAVPTLSLAGRRRFYFALLLAPPLLWLGIVYLGSLFTLLLQSFYAIDEFTARVVPEPTLATYKVLLTRPAHVDIILRTVAMAVAVTIASAVIAFPVALYMARHAGPRHLAADLLLRPATPRGERRGEVAARGRRGRGAVLRGVRDRGPQRPEPGPPPPPGRSRQPALLGARRRVGPYGLRRHDGIPGP